MNSTGFSYRVLVVDDDPAVLEISALVLKERGYEVRKATDGFEALVELRRSMPDVIVSCRATLMLDHKRNPSRSYSLHVRRVLRIVAKEALLDQALDRNEPEDPEPQQQYIERAVSAEHQSGIRQ